MGCSPSKEELKPKEIERLKELSTKLTEEQANHVRSTWPVLGQDLEGCGRILFQRLFVLYPHLKPVFIKSFVAKKYKEKDWPKLIEHHGMIVVRFLGDAVMSLDDAKSCPKMLADIGVMHLNKNIPEDYFPYLWPALNFTLKKKLLYSYSPEVCDAWQTVFFFVIGQMIKGIQEERAKRTLATSKATLESNDKETSAGVKKL